MMRRCLCFTMLCLIACEAALAADVPDPKSDLAANAALQYWQAFAQLPTLDKDVEQFASDWGAAPVDDPAVAKLMANSRATIMFLGRATKLPRCDWGLDYNDGVGLLLPHLSRSRDAVRLAALDARRAFQQHDTQTGWNDVLAIMTLGRHMRSDPIMISYLVGAGLESIGIDVVAPYLPEARLSFAQAKSDLAALPAVPPFTKTLDTEKRFMAEWIIQKLREEDKRQPGAWKDFWKALFTGTQEEANPPQAESAAAAIKMVEDVLPLYDELARYLAMPHEQFQAQYPAFKAETKAKHKLARLLLPAIDAVREKQERTQVRQAMLLTAIAIVEGGPEKLKDFKEPFGSGPFEYRQIGNAFELKSQLKFEGENVTLKIGR